MANERTAPPPRRSPSLPPGARLLARATCPVTSTPNRSRSLALPLAASRRALVGAGYLPGDLPPEPLALAGAPARCLPARARWRGIPARYLHQVPPPCPPWG